MITFTELLKRAKTKGIVVHTPTEEEAIVLLKALDERGYKCSIVRNLTTKTYYKYYKKNTCYTFGISNHPDLVTYGPLNFYQRHGYTIVEFSDINFKEK